MTHRPLAILSLGGSLVVPWGIDTKYLARFSGFIRRNLGAWRFVIVVGGGRTARAFQGAIKSLGVRDQEGLDWMGIFASRLNAELVRLAFGKLVHAQVLNNPQHPPRFGESVAIAAGYKPGHSTDWDAVQLAIFFRVRKVINLTNIDHVYDRDPKKFKAAKPLRQISWKQYRKIAGSSWSPGLNLPFDQIASKLAQKWGIEVDVINGKRLGQVQKALEGKLFEGTRIV